MKKLLLFLSLMFMQSYSNQGTPHNLNELFKDPVMRREVEQRFRIPKDLQTKLLLIKSKAANAKVLGLSRQFPRAAIKEMMKKKVLQAMIDKSEFKAVAIGHTLILEHPEITGYLIKLPLVKDNNMIEGEKNVYQNVSRIPNWIAAKRALRTPYALEQGYNKEIVLPEEKYFWYIGDIRNHERETPNTPLSDDNYVVISSKLPLANPSFKPMMIEQMSELQKLAIKHLIIHGKFWDVSPSNTNFTADGRFAYIDMEQPNNSLAKNFFATDAAKELWNIHAGLMNLDKLLGYPFAQADDETILKLREKILQQ